MAVLCKYFVSSCSESCKTFFLPNLFPSDLGGQGPIQIPAAKVGAEGTRGHLVVSPVRPAPCVFWPVITWPGGWTSLISATMGASAA